MSSSTGSCAKPASAVDSRLHSSGRNSVGRHAHVCPSLSSARLQVESLKASYRQRNIIERSIGWFKECRHLGTRYDKLAVNYVASWMVAMIEKLLRR